MEVFSVEEASAEVGAVSTAAWAPSRGLAPSALYPAGRRGLLLGLPHAVPEACGPAGRGAEWGLGQKRGRQRSGRSERGSGLREPSAWDSDAGPRRGAPRGRAGYARPGQRAAAGPA